MNGFGIKWIFKSVYWSILLDFSFIQNLCVKGVETYWLIACIFTSLGRRVKKCVNKMLWPPKWDITKPGGPNKFGVLFPPLTPVVQRNKSNKWAYLA